jgi:hypothetical protein
MVVITMKIRSAFRMIVPSLFMLSVAVGCGGGNNGEQDGQTEDAPPDGQDPVPDAADMDGWEDALDLPGDQGADGGEDAPPVEHPNENSTLGTNLNGIADWSTEWSFVDAFKMSREWISGSSSQWDDGRPIDVDDKGWVRSLLSDQIARTLLFWDLVDIYPGGQYTVIYEGEGTIEYWNAAARNDALSAPGRDVIDVDPAQGGIGMNITAVNPGNYLRNIRVIVPGGGCSNDAFRWCAGDGDCGGGSCALFADTYETQIFHPTFLDRIKTYRLLRFMDWMSTNGSPIREWSERAEVDDARWSGEAGVPLEIMVDLANRLGADPWFTMPHQATDDFVANFAAMVRDTLDPELHAYVEYSNEVWNGIFDQAGYARDQGLALGLSTNEFEAQLFFYSRRAVEIFGIWENAFGSPDRLVRVMGTQAANSWVSDQVLGFESASDSTDALAAAPYFGGYLGSPDEQARVASMSADDLLAELEGTALPEAIGWMQDQASSASAHGVDLVSYEGGQHLAGHGGVENDDTINALFDEVNRDSRMGGLYATYLEAWRDAGGQVFTHFTSCGGYSKWGRWGSLEYLTQPREEAPKFDALQDFIETTPPWW